MERTLTEFVRALRAAGAAVSSAEAIDAARAMTVIGFDDRATLKAALGIALAKSEEEKQLHDQMFELFFKRLTLSSPTSRHNQKRDSNAVLDQDSGESAGENDAGLAAPNGSSNAAHSGSRDDAQKNDADSSGGASAAQALAAFMSLAQSADSDRITMAIERAGTAVGVNEIRFATQSSYYVRQILAQLGGDALEAELSRIIADESASVQARVREMVQARRVLQLAARSYVDQKFEQFGRSATEAFMNDVVVNRELGQLGLHDMERMRVVVAKMAKRLAIRHSRRRKARNRGQLDIRHTMRANAGYDGVPVELVWKLKRRDRPKIVAICDVSGSVSRYVRFLLMFLYLLKDEITDLNAFAFSAQLKDIAELLRSMSFDKALDRVILEVGGSTDYGQALVDLKEKHWEVIDRRTTVLILGDGRSNQTNPRLDIFQEAADRAKRVVWLCPEPEGRWGTGDSCILQYRPFCDHLSHCATALDLERALDEVLMAYD